MKKKLIAISLFLLVGGAALGQTQNWRSVWDEEADSLTFFQTIVPALKSAAAKGDKEAEIRLCAVFLTTPWGTAENINDGRTRLRKMVDSGNLNALVSLGESYITGRYAVYQSAKDDFFKGDVRCPKDEELGVAYYEKAVAMGHVPAMRKLGEHLVLGVNIRQNVSKGLDLLKKAAGKEDWDACRMLSALYRSENEYDGLIEPDLAESLKYAKMGAEQGDPLLQMKLALVFYNPSESSPGDYPDKLKYAFWLKKSAESDWDMAQYYYGLYLMNEQKDTDKGIEWIQKAADQNNVNAMAELSMYYLNNAYYAACVEMSDRIIAIVDDRASEPYLKAMMRKLVAITSYQTDEQILNYLNSGHYDYLMSLDYVIQPYALYQAGISYISSAKDLQKKPENKKKKYDQEFTRGLHLMQIGADQYNDPYCLFYLSLCYDLGRMVKKDSQRAHSYLVRAARAGSEKAIEYCRNHGISYE